MFLCEIDVEEKAGGFKTCYMYLNTFKYVKRNEYSHQF